MYWRELERKSYLKSEKESATILFSSVLKYKLKHVLKSIHT